MERSRSARNVIFLALLVTIIGMSIGFAAMSTTLNIQGTAELNPATWKINFANLSSPSLTGSAAQITAPTINGTSNTIISTYNVRLTRPGDKVVYTFDVRNQGDINASISSFSKPAPVCVGTGPQAAADATLVCSNLVYTLKYTSGGANVQVGDTLTTGQTRNMTLTIEYPLAMQQLPISTVNISAMDITMVYTQI